MASEKTYHFYKKEPDSREVLNYFLELNSRFIKFKKAVTSSEIGNLVSWGEIVGTLSAQTDLQTALNLKANTSALSGYGTLAGTQTWSGVNTFNQGGSSTAALKVVAVSGSVLSPLFELINDGVTTFQITRGGSIQGIGVYGNYFLAKNGAAELNLPSGNDNGAIAIGNNIQKSYISSLGSGVIGLGFFTGSTPTERLRVHEGGNVSIGSTTDDGVNKLQVNGRGYFSGNITLANDKYIGNDTNTNISFGGSNTFIGATGLIKLSGGGVSPNANDLLVVTGSNVGIKSGTPTHSLTLGSTSTGFAHYNTIDQTTNFERVRSYWNGNVYNLTTEGGGTGSVRQLSLNGSEVSLKSYGGNVAFFRNSGIEFYYPLSFNNQTSSLSSGTYNQFNIFPTINQSGTAGYRGIFVSPYEQATGSGSKLLLDLGTNSAANGGGTHTSKFSVNNLGNVQFGGSNAAISGSVGNTVLVFGSALEISGNTGLLLKSNFTTYGQLFSTGRWFFGGSPVDDGVSVANFNGAVKITGQLTIAPGFAIVGSTANFGITGDSFGYFNNEAVLYNSYAIRWSSTTDKFGVKDVGLLRDGAGVLQINDGITSGNYRDLRLRNTIATQYRLSALNTAPSSATDTGVLGEIRITAGFIYVCIATNTWVRTSLATW